MNKMKEQVREYSLQWEWEPRILHEQLGSQKYSTSTRALGELVSNSLDAGATQIDIDVNMNDLGGIESVVIKDNGQGITPDELSNRFVLVGVQPYSDPRKPHRLGRFGVGRLAVHRIGSQSEWSTVADLKDGTRVMSQFKIMSGQGKSLNIKERTVSAETALGTTIEIFAILDKAEHSLTPARIRNDILAQFCSYLLANKDCNIRVAGEVLDVEVIVESRETEMIDQVKDEIEEKATIDHLLLNKPIEQTRFPAQLIFSAKGLSVASHKPEEVPSNRYLGLVDCDYLDSIITSNREALIEMDEVFAHLKDAAVEKMRDFGKRLRADQKHRFIERAREEDFYPYRDAPSDAVSIASQFLYDVVLERVNESINLEGMTKKQRAVVFRLLNRALKNENLLDILDEVAKLSDEDMVKFRKVLERTTLDSIIRLSYEVTNRLTFLDILHKLVYGDISKHLKERSQLHKIIESQCWIFGPRFYMATSDKSFREIIRSHRKQAGLEDIDDDVINNISGIADIPDLFLSATRDYPVNPKHHHLLVELKAPSVNIGLKEHDQIYKYARTILNSSQFDKTSTQWDLFLVSSKASEDISLLRQQKDKPHGCTYEGENMTIWAFEWSEIISKAREEMQLVKDHLQKKSTELTVSEFLRDSFPDILESLKNGEISQSMTLKSEIE
jgi:hypothetical protein